jgi:TonB family protein
MGSAQGPVLSELEQARTAPEFGAHTPLSEKLLAVAIRAQNFTGSTGVAIALTEGQEMICRANWGTSAPEVGAKLSIENSFTGLCVRAGEPLRCDDAQSDPRVDPEACRALGISAIAAAPVRRGLKVIGVIAAFSDTPNAFTDKHLLILTTLSEVIVELLDDPQPIQPLPQATEAAPDLARATAVVQAPVTPTLDRTALRTLVPEPARPSAEAAPVAPAAPVQPEPVMAAAPPTPEPTTPVLPSLSPPASTAASSKAPERAMPHDRALDLFEASARKDEVLPAAMDPGPPRQQPKASLPPQRSKDGFGAPGSAGPARLALVKQGASTPAPDFSTELTFSGLEADAGTRRRWLLPAAILAIFAVLAVAGWRLHVARNASAAKHAPAAPALESQSASAGQTEQAQDTKPSEPAAAEAKHSPFSPPPMADVVPPPVKVAPALEQPPDVTLRRGRPPVIEAAGPVRRAAATGTSGTAQVPEAQAPQLALSTPELPTALARPAPAAVAAPVSRVVPAQLNQRVEPVYPEAARRLKVSGRVVVKATITKAGIVGNVQWVGGNELFRDTTLAAVKQWRYKPATLNGQPVESDLEIVLQFSRPTTQ